MNVLLFSPVRQSPDILAPVLRSHAELRGIKERIYIDDNDDPESSRMLAASGAEVERWDSENKPDYSDHKWNQANISRIASLRHFALEEFRSRAYLDAILMVDSDLILHPDMLGLMLCASQRKHIVSEVFWSRWDKEDSVPLPNVWDKHPYGFNSNESIIQLRECCDTFEVGGLGACTLIPRSAVESGASYLPIPSLPYEGEDRHFCVRASALGIKLLADTHHPPYHIYRESQLPEALAWQNAGCPPQYFRNMWLTDEWADAIRSAVPAAQRQVSPRRKVALFSPGEWFHWMWNAHWTLMHSELKARHDTVLHFGYSSNVYLTRNQFAETVKASPSRPDYVIWIDDDQLVDYSHVEKLMSVLDSDPSIDMACGWTVMFPEGTSATAAWASCGWSDEDGNHCFRKGQLNGVRNVDWTGFPLVVMRMSALDKAGDDAFFPYPPYTKGLPGEDTAFCRRLIDAGGRIVVDSSVYVPHLKLRALVADQAETLATVSR